MEHFSPGIIPKETGASAEPQLSSGLRTWLLAAAVLVVVLLVANGELLRGKAYPQWDAADFFGPEYSLVADHVRAHRLLTWDPWTSGGTPDFAEPELGASSPILLIVTAIFAKPSGFIVYWMLIWIAGALGMLVFTKHLRCPPWGALVAALGFAASGFFIAHAEHTSSLFSIAFLPWILWRFDDALQRARYWSAVQAGVLYGLSALGGYPQFTILTPSFLALWAVGRVLFSDTTYEISGGVSNTPRPRFLPSIAALLLVGVIGVLILAPPYLAFMTETHGYSDRVGPRPRIESISSNLLPAKAITTLASPYIFLLSYPGLPGRLWPGHDLTMSNIYSGAVVSVLGLLALFNRLRWRRWLGLVALFYLCCSVGNQLPLRGWLYDYVLPTRYFRNASMFSVYSIFLLCILAALAARDMGGIVQSEGAEAERFLVLSFAAAASAGVSFFLIIRQVQVHPWRFNFAVIHLVVVWLGMVIAGLLLVSHLTSIRRFTQVLLALAVLDAILSIVIAKPVLYTSATASEWHEMDQGHVTSLDLTSRGFSRELNSPAVDSIAQHLNNSNVPLKVAVLDSYAPLNNRFQSALVADALLRELAVGTNRVWFSGTGMELAPTDNAYEKFRDNAHRRGSSVLILHNPDQMSHLSFPKNSPPATPQDAITSASLDQLEPVSVASVDLLKYLPDSLQFRYQAPRDGWLMITDRWAPGWRAEVNGKPEQVYGADFLFRAVRVAAGLNTVTLRYEPPTWVPSIIVSWGTLLLFFIFEGLRIVRRKRLL